MLFVKIKPANTWAAIHLQNKDIPSQPSKPRENKLFWIKYAQYFIRLRIKYAYYSFRIKYVRYVSFNYAILPPTDYKSTRGACIVSSPSCGTGDYHYYHLEATKLPGESVQSLIWHWIELY